MGAQQQEDGVVPGDGAHQAVPGAGVHRDADGVGHAGEAFYHNEIPREIHRFDGLQEHIVDVEGEDLRLLFHGKGVVIIPRGGKGLHQAQLLDVPGNGGLGSVKAGLGQMGLELLLGGDGVVLYDAEKDVYKRQATDRATALERSAILLLEPEPVDGFLIVTTLLIDDTFYKTIFKKERSYSAITFWRGWPLPWGWCSAGRPNG